MAMWVVTAKDVGFTAYHQNTPRCLNPYEPGTPDAELWLQGWDEAETRAQHVAAAHLIFPQIPGICDGCGTSKYTVLELNLYPEQINQCYECTARKRIS